MKKKCQIYLHFEQNYESISDILLEKDQYIYFLSTIISIFLLIQNLTTIIKKEEENDGFSR